jgi:hypothetical protein
MVLHQQNAPHTETIRTIDERTAEITGYVLDRLGRPRDLRSVQVRPLWNDRYRVNIFVGADVASVRIAHSYFLVVDPQGSVIAATPKITKEY